MRRVLRKGFQNYEVLEWHACRPEDTCKEFRDRFAALNFLCSFMCDSLSMMNLRSIFYGGSYNGGSTRLNDHQMLEHLALRLVAGQLRILELPLDMPAWSPVERPVEEEPAETAAAVTLETAWIEFNLIDDDGQPVADAKYKIKLPDGEIIEGLLDSNGTARCKNIPSGDCVIKFPEYSQEELGIAS